MARLQTKQSQQRSSINGVINLYLEQAVEYSHQLSKLVLFNAHSHDAAVVSAYGHGPFNNEDLGRLIPSFWKFTPHPGSDTSSTQMQSEPDYFIVIGRYLWEPYKDDIADDIDQNKEHLKVLSQEGLIDLLLFGQDWWNNDNHDFLNSEADHHPGLAYARSLSWFKWPHSSLSQTPQASSGTTFEYGEREQSELSKAGYVVGLNGKSQTKRREILDKFVRPSEWGLERVAYHIARRIYIARKNPTDQSRAIKHWVSDLRWLHETYYLGRINKWRWPE